MRLARLTVGVWAAIALAAAPFGADAKGGKGGGGRGGGHSGARTGAHHSHHHGGHGFAATRVFIGSSFVVWPAAYYWPGYHPGAVPAVEYWYYCQPYAAYYPYVQECPTEWQPVLPTAPSPES